MLRKAADDHQIRGSAEEVLKLLRSNRRKDIIDLLIVRRIVEVEGARLAAMNASKKMIARLEEIVRKQKTSITSGSLAVEEDVRFHETLAKASGNQFIAYSVHLLRSRHWLNYAVIAIRAKLGAGLAVDHEEIIAAVKARNPDAALMTMQRHITTLLGEVERYWD